MRVIIMSKPFFTGSKIHWCLYLKIFKLFFLIKDKFFLHQTQRLKGVFSYSWYIHGGKLDKKFSKSRSSGLKSKIDEQMAQDDDTSAK